MNEMGRDKCSCKCIHSENKTYSEIHVNVFLVKYTQTQ